MNFRRAQLILILVTTLFAVAVYAPLRNILIAPVTDWFLGVTGDIGLNLQRPLPELLFFFLIWFIIYFGIIKFLSPNVDAVDYIERFFGRKEKAEPQWDVNSPQNVQVRRKLIANLQLQLLHEKSLKEKIHIVLNLEYDTTKLDRPLISWDGQPNRRRPVPSDKGIGEIFEESGRDLLILGEPGSGKTYTLEQLALQLLETVTPENSKPIPVILNLSSWAAKKPDFSEWLVEQMFLQYRISRTITPDLLQSGQLWLLLDGLDEVEESARGACVEVINQFQGEAPIPLVVCSRIKEYDSLSSQLKLTNAVAIQPLNDAQIAGYLLDPRLQLYAVHEAIQNDDALKELAQTPLFLFIMALAYQGYSPGDLRPLMDDVGQRQYHLYQSYIRGTFSRLRGNIKSYKPEKSLKMLAYEARKFNRDKVFEIISKNLQITIPKQDNNSYLPTLRNNFYYLITTYYIKNPKPDWFKSEAIQRNRLFSTFIFVLLHSFFNIMFCILILKISDGKINPKFNTNLFGGLVIGFFGGLLSEIWYRRRIWLDIWLISPLVHSWKRGDDIGYHESVFKLLNALVFGFVVGIITGFLFATIGGIYFGMIIGVIYGLVGGVLKFGEDSLNIHRQLRVQLYQKGLLPYRFRPFFDAMVGRIILQRNGPNYRFIHRTLQEHFAALTEEEIEALAQEIEGGSSR